MNKRTAKDSDNSTITYELKRDVGRLKNTNNC